MSQWSSQRRRSIREPQQGTRSRIPPLTSIETTQKTQSLLIHLSDSCQKHKTLCHPTDKNEDCAQKLEQAPESCQTSLNTLTRILPQVEAALSAGDDIVHLSHFYANALEGGFCPHAPHLFLRQSTVFPRVKLLLEYLSCNERSVDIERTVAKLLSRLPDSKLLFQQVVPELVDLVYELAVAACRYVAPSPTKFTVLEKSMQESSSTQMDPIVVELGSLEDILAFQATTFAILDHLLALLRERRLFVTSLTAIYDEIDEHCFTVVTAIPNVTRLLGAVRHVLFTNACGPARPSALRILGRLDRVESTVRHLLVARGLVEYWKRPCEEESDEWLDLVWGWDGGSDPACWKAFCASIPLLGKGDNRLKRAYLYKLLRGSVQFVPSLLDLLVDPAIADLAVGVAARSMAGRLLNIEEIARSALDPEDVADKGALPSTKRFKVEDSSAVGSIDDHCLTFMRHALKTTANWRNNTHEIPLVDEIVTVSSALKLMVTLATRSGTHPSPSSIKFCEMMIIRLVALGKRLPNPPESGTCSQEQYALLSCAIALEAMPSKVRVDPSPLFDIAKEFFAICTDPCTLELPESLRDATLCAYACLNVDQKLPHQTFLLIGMIPASVRHEGLLPTLRTGLAALCHPLTNDTNLQSVRLRQIERILGSGVATSLGSIEDQTMRHFSSLPVDQPPLLQLLMWQSIAWFFFNSTGDRVKKMLTSKAISVLQFLLNVPLTSNDTDVREYCGRECGRVLAVTQWTLVNSLYRTVVADADSEFSDENGIVNLFDYLEHKRVEGGEDSFRAVVDILDSCVHATSTPFLTRTAVTATEHAIMPLMRIWNESSSSRKRRADRTFCIQKINSLPWKALADIAATILPGIFKEIVVIPIRKNTDSEDFSSIPPRVWASHFHNFSRVVSLIEGASQGSAIAPEDSENLVIDTFPASVSKFVRERDYHALLLMAGYRSFQKISRKSSMKNRKRTRSMSIPGPVALGSHLLVAKHMARSWVRGVDDSLQEQCLTPGLIERIIPVLLREANGDDLTFFRETVLGRKLSLQDLIASRDSLILKNLIIYVGENPSSRAASIGALERAVMAQERDIDVHKDISNSHKASGNERARYREAVVRWVTSHFMNLLVNVAQSKWVSESIEQRTRALRSLEFSLEFLNPKEAPQYLPQIMATVNSALDEKLGRVQEKTSTKDLAVLFTQAIHVLSKFVKLAAPANLEILGENMTSFVVTLVPVLAGTEHDFKEPQKLAAGILSWLSHGELGQKLAPYFATLPFIPRTDVLEPFRLALRSHGVEIHELEAGEESAPSSDDLDRMTGDVSLGGDSSGTSDEISKQRVLRRKLTTLCPLLHNENTSVRRVVLRHLASLLRSNRELFLNLLYNERWASSDFLTVESGKSRSSQHAGSSCGVLQEIVDTLLRRCAEESDPDSRVLLAKCFGEVGAIDLSTNGLDDLNREFITEDDKYRHRPPWLRDPPRLHLISSHLVVALKASQTSSDQHKVAFAIQQLLSQMNNLHAQVPITPRQKSSGVAMSSDSTSKGDRMDPALVDQLSQAGVLDIVEPFWYSEFQEVETIQPRQPPFFKNSASYFFWISNWVRYMIHRSYETEQSEWTKVFHACRTAVKAQAGLRLAEFLLPTLIAFQICFGSGRDRDLFLREIEDALGKDARHHNMPPTELLKSISTVFSTLETLHSWVDVDRKTAVKRQKADNKRTPCPKDVERKKWATLDPSKRIRDAISKVLFQTRARAAASVNLQACALRFFELASREAVAEAVFDPNAPAVTALEKSARHDPTRSLASGKPTEVHEMKSTLMALGDYETMSSLEEVAFLARSPERTFNKIREKEGMGDWQGALHDYERSIQEYPEESSLRTGTLRCLLGLGHFESLIQQAKAITTAEAKPLAVEASCRLGRWESIEELVADPTVKLDELDPDGQYQLSLGKIMASLHNKKDVQVNESIQEARNAVMESLSSTARENYGRAYKDIVRLHILREIEDSSAIVCSSNPLCLGEKIRNPSWGWSRRLEMLSMNGSMEVVRSRIAMARLVGDRELEASLFVKLGRIGRKLGSQSTATSSLSHAESILCCLEGSKATELKGSLRLEIAKLKHANEEGTAALKILGKEDLKDFFVSNPVDANDHSVDRDTAQGDIMGQVRSALKATRWIIEGGLVGCEEIISRFESINRVAPTFEKGHFHYAKYIDSLLHSRILALQGRCADGVSNVSEDVFRSQALQNDLVCQQYIVQATKHYVETLRLDVKLHKYVYEALPRLLSLWFEFTSIHAAPKQIERPQRSTFRLTQQTKEPKSGADTLNDKQTELSSFMAKVYKNIPAHAFFTALPQIVSRVNHGNNDTSCILSAILKRTLVKFPAQAMWPLAWIRQSQDPERRRIGAEVFHKAVQTLKEKGGSKFYNLLKTSTSLLDYLYEIAVAKVSPHLLKCPVKPLSSDTNLLEFVPPIQSALSISLTSGDSGRARDIFPRYIPRMRAIDTEVVLMPSKARPKKLRIIMVSAEDVTRLASSSGADDLDIGELHFLLKQEIKGDLRKDARVQDLNCVVNRIMQTNGGIVKKLRLQTFMVTCLSEDTGLVEWIPKTCALRNCISSSVNDLVREHVNTRDGSRIVDFRNPKFRSEAERIQKMYANGEKNAAKDAFIRFTKTCPPVLYWYFIDHFKNPHAWYEARTRFTLSTAAWSAIGHVVGLGDRHTENILVVENSGECVHVDFDCIFDKGLTLPKPELVPFRLTQNLIDAFGPTGADGVYSSSLKTAMAALRKNRDTILANLEPFLKDPVINWKKSRGQQRRLERDSLVVAKRQMVVIEQRLQGHYNLQAKRRKPGNTDPMESNDDGQNHSIPLSVEGQVHKMIAEATDPENLLQLYFGWLAWV